MESLPKTSSAKRRLSAAEWTRAVDQYELGHGNFSRLAELFCISRQAMAEGLRKRGAIKGVRVSEVVAPLHRWFDRRDDLRLQCQLALTDALMTWLLSAFPEMKDLDSSMPLSAMIAAQ